MIIDTHAHYDADGFDTDREELLASMYEGGIEKIVNVCAAIDELEDTVKLVEKYPFIYAAVGWHPEGAEEFDEGCVEKLRRWAKHPKVRAIGEIGLDYYYETPERELQKRVFRRQLELAAELGLPVVVHDREAHEDCMEILRAFPEVRGEFHCYSGSAEMAKEILARGWYLGFTGVITFKNARKAIEVLEICPPERILIETDCPYLAPVPLRGKRNDSRNLKYVAERIAEIKGMSTQEVICLTTENGKRFFGIE